MQRRTVTGLSILVFHSANGSVQLPDDLTNTGIEAIAPDGAGGFERIAASSLRSDGTYAIAGVPEGGHWVRFGLNHVWTDAGFIDWSVDSAGRADVAVATQPTRLTIEAGNLSPWQVDDTLAWVVPMHGSSFALPLNAAAVTNPPRALDTALGNFGLDAGPGDTFFVPLLDAAKGDQAYLNQLVSQPGSGVRVLSRTLPFPPLTMTDGSTTPLRAGFLDVTKNASLGLVWHRSAYAVHAAEVNPMAVPTSSVMGLSVSSLYPLYGALGDAASLVEFNTFGTADLDFGRIAYGNPYPSSWTRIVDGAMTFTARYLAPGALVPEPLERGLVSSEALDPAAGDDTSLTLGPRLSPARAPMINGKTLFANQLAVGTSPELSWSPPAIGSPNQYFVRLIELSADGSRSRLRTVARFYTAERSMVVPPGLMQPGHLYVITIAALHSGSPVTQPFRSTLPFAFATLMSAIVSP